MERDQALKFMHDLLRLMLQKNGSDLFITAGFPPAIKVDGRSCRSRTRSCSRSTPPSWARDHERPPGRRLRDPRNATSASRRRASALPRQRLRAAGRVGWCCAPSRRRSPRFEELGLPPVLTEIGMAKRGLVIFVGGTGTGSPPTWRR